MDENHDVTRLTDYDDVINDACGTSTLCDVQPYAFEPSATSVTACVLPDDSSSEHDTDSESEAGGVSPTSHQGVVTDWYEYTR